MQPNPVFHVHVMGFNTSVPSPAVFSWRSDKSDAFQALRSEPFAEGRYMLFPDFKLPAQGILRIEAGKLREDCEIVLQPWGLSLEVVLASADQASVRRGNLRIPLVVRPEKIAVFMGPDESQEKAERIEKRISGDKRAALRMAYQPPALRSQRIDIDAKDGKEAAALGADLAEQLKDENVRVMRGAIQTGPDLYYWPTGRIFITLRKPSDFAQLKTYLKGQPITGIYQEYVAPQFIAITYGNDDVAQLMQFIASLAALEYVVEAIPAVHFQDEDELAVLARDILRPAQWHLNLLNVPDAWESLQNHRSSLVYGDPDMVIAILDRGIETVGGVVQHPDLLVNINGGNISTLAGNTNKIAFQYQFDHSHDPATLGNLMVANNDNRAPAQVHGINVTGLLGAGSDNDMGVTGVAPNVRLASYIRLVTGADALIKSRNYRYMAGLWAGWSNDGTDYHATQVFPHSFGTSANPVPGAGVINMSHSGYGAALLPGALNNSWLAVTMFARNRRGSIMLTSAGNGDRNTRTSNQWGNETNILKIAASSLDHRSREMPAPYTDFSTAVDPLIDFCTPSGSNIEFVPLGGLQIFHQPPQLWGQVTIDRVGMANTPGTNSTTAAIQNALGPADTVLNLLGVDFPNFPVGKVVVIQDTSSTTNVVSRTITAVNAVANTITVDAGVGFNFGLGNSIVSTGATVQNVLAAGATNLTLLAADFPNFPVTTPIIVRDPANLEHTEIRTVAAIAAAPPNTITLDHGLQFGYAAAQIFTGAIDYNRGFAGTSGAAPLASGVATLVLSANPALTWIEARDIMRSTAMPIALHYLGQGRNKRWVQFDGTPTGQDLIDANGIFVHAAPALTTGDALAKGQTDINVGANGGFALRQSVLIGAETRLNAAVVLPTSDIVVARETEFAEGDTIFIGKRSETILTRGFAAGGPLVGKVIVVQNPDGFAVGDNIDIGGQLANISAIAMINLGGSTDYRGQFTVDKLDVIPWVAGNRHDIVRIHTTQLEGPLTIDTIAGTTITLDNPLAVAHPINQIVYKQNTEMRVVRALVNADTIRVDPLDNAHPLTPIPGGGGNHPIHVVGGRRADYNFALGFGRLDAKAAVDAAIAFTHNLRDLVIRNWLKADATQDDGVTNLHKEPVHSPDLWVRHDAPTAGIAYNDLPPHEHPRLDVSAPIFDGTGLNDLNAGGDYTGAAPGVYTIEIIDAASNPDKYVWYKDGGAPSAAADIVAGAIAIAEGLTVTFGAVDGHTLGDKWHIQVEDIANRILHLRVRNRGTQPSYAPSTFAGALDVAQYRMLLCLSDGTPPAVFHGTGLNDLTVTTEYTGSATDFFTVRISATGATDSYQWAKNGAIFSAATPIPGAGGNIALSDGVNVAFAAITGHTNQDLWHIRCQPAQKVQFHGWGLNDMAVTQDYNGADREFFRIKIIATGAADQFIWNKGDGAFSPPIAITGAAQALSDDVEITFAAVTGHSENDTWIVQYYPHAQKFISIDHYIESNPPVAFNLSTNRTGTFLLPAPGAGRGISALGSGANNIYNINWAEANRPPRNGPGVVQPARPLRMFLLGEVTPHDGKLMGDTPDHDNNFSYRELVFARFQFANGVGLTPLESFFEVPALGGTVNKDFRVNVIVDVGTYTAERVKLVFKLKKNDATEEEKVYRYDSGAWSWDGGAPAWVSGMVPPREIGSPATNATGEQWGIYFVGTFNVDNNHARVEIIPQIYSAVDDTLVIAEEEKKVPVYTEAALSTQRFNQPDAAKLAPRSHFFSQANLLSPQAPGDKYGIIDFQNYRVTSIFTANSGAHPPAYAIVKGKIFVQRIPGNNDVVNMVLKPMEQPMLGFTPIKYVVYRGIKLDEVLKGSSAADEVEVAPSASASPWLQRLWPIHTATNGAVPFESRMIGFEPATQTPADKLDSFFFSLNAEREYPAALAGERIGSFWSNGGAAKFGIDIVLEEGSLELDLAYVQQLAHIVTTSGMPAGTPAEIVDILHKREEILHFIDMAAFLGMHVDDDARLTIDDGAGNKSTKPKGDIYADILDKFETRNTVYLDIRNEHDQSLNLHGKYDDGSGNALEVGPSAGSLVARPYYSTEWPIITDVNAGSANANPENELHVRLRLDYNNKPILYVEHGKVMNGAAVGRFVAGDDLFTSGNPTTEILGFKFPNHDVGAGNKAHIPWMIKLHYNLRLDSANSPFPPEVPDTEKYIDNLFGPLDIKITWAGAHTFAWVTAQDKKFMDGETDLGAAHTVDRGLAKAPAGRALFFAAVKDSFTNGSQYFVPQKGLSGGTSKRNTFFVEPQLFEGYQLRFDVLDDGGTVTTLQLDTDPDQKRLPEGMLLLGISDGQLTTLKGLGGFQPRFPRAVQLDELAGSPFTDPNGVIYRKYRLGVRGLDTLGLEKTDYAAPAIEVYSVDGLFFFSEDFSAAEPIPADYVRNYEESIGALKRIPRSFIIDSVNTGTKTFTIAGVDLTREIVAGDTVTVRDSATNDNDYDVASVSFATDTNIVVVQAIPTADPSLGFLHQTAKDWEKFFYEADIAGAVGGTPDNMKTIVANFAAAISGIANAAGAEGSFHAPIDTHGAAILTRARALAKDSSRAYVDDRMLYWARIAMVVELKDHPFCKVALSARNRLVNRLERISRGLDGTTFAGAGGAKKVLVAGFDPYELSPHDGLENPYNASPSAAAALALHGETLSDGGGNNAYVQGVILPMRYRDFGEGPGVVEGIFEPHMDGVAAAEKADLILNLATGDPFVFGVERFASRYRGGKKDNENRPVSSPPAFDFPDEPDGDQFHETSLPVDKIVPAGNAGMWKIYFQQNFHYTYVKDGSEEEAYLRLGSLHPNFDLQPGVSYDEQPADGDEKIEKGAHPRNGNLVGKTPNKLNNLFAPKKKNIAAKWGSAGDFLPNELFYRVCLLREAHDNNQEIGLLTLPRLQAGPDLRDRYNLALGLSEPNSVDIDFDPVLTKAVLDLLETLILQAITP
ncbi:MAG: S8 family serine peptidase [Bacteroidota bacterium]